MIGKITPICRACAAHASSIVKSSPVRPAPPPAVRVRNANVAPEFNTISGTAPCEATFPRAVSRTCLRKRSDPSIIASTSSNARRDVSNSCADHTPNGRSHTNSFPSARCFSKPVFRFCRGAINTVSKTRNRPRLSNANDTSRQNRCSGSGGNPARVATAATSDPNVRFGSNPSGTDRNAGSTKSGGTDELKRRGTTDVDERVSVMPTALHRCLHRHPQLTHQRSEPHHRSRVIDPLSKRQRRSPQAGVDPINGGQLRTNPLHGRPIRHIGLGQRRNWQQVPPLRPLPAHPARAVLRHRPLRLKGLPAHHTRLDHARPPRRPRTRAGCRSEGAS